MVENRQVACCENCNWYMQSGMGYVCKNHDSRHCGAWVNEKNCCEKHRWKEDGGTV